MIQSTQKIRIGADSGSCRWRLIETDRRPFFDISNFERSRAESRSAMGRSRSAKGRDTRRSRWPRTTLVPIVRAPALARERWTISTSNPHVRSASQREPIEPTPFAALSHPTSPRLPICAHLCNLWSNSAVEHSREAGSVVCNYHSSNQLLQNGPGKSGPIKVNPTRKLVRSAPLMVGQYPWNVPRRAPGP